MFENRVLRRIFGPNRGEVTGEWRRVQNEELNDLYSSTNIVRVKKSRAKWEGHVAGMRERGIYRVWGGKPKERRPPERPRRIWEDNIKMDLQDVGRGMDWRDLAQERDRCRVLVNAVNLQVT